MSHKVFDIKAPLVVVILIMSGMATFVTLRLQWIEERLQPQEVIGKKETPHLSHSDRVVVLDSRVPEEEYIIDKNSFDVIPCKAIVVNYNLILKEEPAVRTREVGIIQNRVLLEVKEKSYHKSIVNIRDEQLEDYWYRVTFNGEEGWVFGYFLDFY